MEDKYTFIFEYDKVMSFLDEIGVPAHPIMNFKKTIKQISKTAFEQNLKASLDHFQKDKRTIIYRPKNSKKITLRKIRISNDGSGKSNGYRCYVILDEINKVIIMTSIYTHATFDNLPQKDLTRLKEICDAYHVISEGNKNDQQYRH